MTFFDSETFIFFVVPLLIFLARICDVSLGTIRIIFVSRGHKFLAPFIGFFEVLIWLVAIGKIMQNLSNPSCYISYAAGFAAGTFVGIYIEEKLAMGVLLIRIITRKDATELTEALESKGYGVTSLPARGSSGEVSVVYSVVKRGDLDGVLVLIKKFNPKAFYSVEDVRFVSHGVFPERKSGFWLRRMNPLRFFRESK
jgi:uncharacterized protein YebE (UPF0316 family)